MDLIPVQDELDQIAESLSPLHLDWVSVIIAVAVFGASIVVGRMARRSIRRLAVRVDIGSPALFATAGRLSSYVIVVGGFAAGMRVLGISVIPVLGALGVIAVVAAIALRPFLENFSAGITLQLNRPIVVGDDVEIDGVTGTVVELTARTVVVDTPAGTRAFVPNRSALDSVIINYTARGRRRETLEVGLAYESDLVLCTRTMLSVAQATRGVHADPEPQAFVREFGDSTINVDLRYWHDPQISSAPGVRHEVAVNLKKAFDARGIEIAFPQVVVWPADTQPAPAAI